MNKGSLMSLNIFFSMKEMSFWSECRTVLYYYYLCSYYYSIDLDVEFDLFIEISFYFNSFGHFFCFGHFYF